MIKFLIWSNQHGAWWAPGARGYTLDIAQAGRFARHQALRIVDGAGSWGPYAGDGVPDEVMVLAPEYRWDSGPPEPGSVGGVEHQLRRADAILSPEYVDARLEQLLHAAGARRPANPPKGYRCPACKHSINFHREGGCDVDDCECFVPWGQPPPGDPEPEHLSSVDERALEIDSTRHYFDVAEPGQEREVADRLLALAESELRDALESAHIDWEPGEGYIPTGSSLPPVPADKMVVHAEVQYRAVSRIDPSPATCTQDVPADHDGGSAAGQTA